MRALLIIALFTVACGSPSRTVPDGGLDTAVDSPPNPFPDSDGDLLLDSAEIGPNAASPVDSNSDGTPDYLDPDCDDDGILDGHDSLTDTDRDGTVNYLDTDSDADGVNDSIEAGDSDLQTAPIDSDADGAPDFVDPDSDDDGLSDRRESESGTDRTRADSDDDGVSDLVEVAAGTNPLLSSDSPRTRGDFVFVVPQGAPPSPTRDTLDFATTIRSADIYFVMDTTMSMETSIVSLRDNIQTFIPQVRAVMSDAHFGVGEYRDYPVYTYGVGGMPPTDYVYRNRTSITTDMTAIEAGLAQYAGFGGSDVPEASVPALWAMATGMAVPGTSNSPMSASCPSGTFGFPCFRDGAVPIVVLISDQPTHNGPGGANPYDDSFIGAPTPTFDIAMAALNESNINIIGIGQGTMGEEHLRAICTATGSLDSSGNPLYSTWSGGEIGDTVLTQIQALANAARFDVSVRFVDDPTDTVDTWASFVDRLVPNETGHAPRGCAPRTAVDTNADGQVDTFPGVQGQRVCFDVVPKQNDVVSPTSVPQLFRATIQVIGDGFTVLDERDVFFLVPPRVEIGIG